MRMIAVRIVLKLALILVPVCLAAMWLASERETFTKSAKICEVEVEDDLFGDYVESRAVPGPILGYYVGLDAVGGVTALCAAAGAVFWWRERRRRAADKRRSDET